MNVYQVLSALADAIRTLEQERDSFAQQVKKLGDQLGDAEDGLHERSQRIAELEIELARVRGGEA